ncbi:DUF4279 domain-containing protein [Niallia circulans]|uniref:DUF4279 domain-containing protein n=1 Tax=Niallia circulans TaxID=1397 RepID=UPI00300A9ACB
MEKTNVKVYFSVKADDFFLEDFTNELGIKPTRAYRKGEAVKRPSNPNVTSKGTHYRLHTSWELGTDYEESLDINEQLNSVLSQLEDKAEELNRLKRKYGLAYRFVIVIQIENNEKPAMYFDRRFIRFADSIGAEVDFDLYVYS